MYFCCLSKSSFLHYMVVFVIFRKGTSLNKILYTEWILRFIEIIIYCKSFTASLPSSSSLPVVMNTHLSSHSCRKKTPQALNNYCIGCKCSFNTITLFKFVFTSPTYLVQMYFLYLSPNVSAIFCFNLIVVAFVITSKILHSNHS